MPINPVPSTPVIVDDQRTLVPVYQAWFSSIQNWLRPVGSSGTTAKRPVNSTQSFMYVGQMYFDVTLGKPIFVQSLNPTVWIDASGTVV